MNYSKTPEARTTRRTAIAVGAIALATALMLVLPAIALTTTTTAFAAEPADADCWGDVTSDAATEDGQVNLGQHSASFAPEPRVGLPNVLDELGGGVETPRDPEHPSEVGEAVANC